MKGMRICLLLLALVATGSASAETRALLLMANEYGTNYFLLREFMEEFGWDITTTALTPTVTPCGSYGGPLGCQTVTVDLLLSEIEDVTAYDCLTLVSATAWEGNSHAQLLESPEALAFVAEAAQAGMPVLAWCGATRVLAAADLIQGRTVTGHPLYEDEYIAAGATYIEGPPPPIVDGNIITARRGQYYAPEAIDVIAVAID